MRGIGNFSINKKSNSWTRFFIGTCLILFFLFILNVATPVLKNYFFAMSSPMQKTFWRAGESSSSFLGSFLNAAGLSVENEKLKEENWQLLSQITSLQSADRAENDLKYLSESSADSGFNFVAASVMGLEKNDIVSINKGSDDGIFEGMPVVSKEKVLYGKVYKVYKNFSEIILISNANSVVNVKIRQDQDTDGVLPIEGVIKGMGGASAYLDLIPINSNIEPQQVLVTSATESSFPRDLPVGRILEKEKNDQDPFQKAKIDLFLDVSSLDNLFVITNYKR